TDRAADDRGSAGPDPRRHHHRRHDPQDRGLHRGGGGGRGGGGDSRRPRAALRAARALHRARRRHAGDAQGKEGMSAPSARATSASPAAPSARGEEARRRGFEATRVWIFDLDNTLYPAECNLFAQVDQKMGEFIARFLGVPFDYARHLQKTYYRQFGTTLTGLMQVHRMDPKPFLDYVHDLDLSVVPEHPELAAALDRLPGRKLIFTNGSRGHAERVASKLGVLQCFEG